MANMITIITCYALVRAMMTVFLMTSELFWILLLDIHLNKYIKIWTIHFKKECYWNYTCLLTPFFGSKLSKIAFVAKIATEDLTF